MRFLLLTISCMSALAGGCAAKVHEPGKKVPKVQFVASGYAVQTRGTKPAAPGVSPPVNVAAADRKDQILSWAVVGWGKDVKDAEVYALKKTQDKLNAYLLSLNPPIVWTPPADYLAKNVLTGPPQLNSNKEMVNGEEMQSWSWAVKLVPSDLDYFRREDGKYRALLAAGVRSIVAEERMVDLGKGVALVLLVLGGVWLVARKGGVSRECRRV